MIITIKPLNYIAQKIEFNIIFAQNNRPVDAGENMLKNTRIYSIISNKCPKCHEGQVFKNNSAYWPVREFDKMNKDCSHCGQSFMPEPGFYYGAMYISYAFYVAMIVAAVIVGINWLGMEITELLPYLIGLFVFLTPVFFRMARRVWLTIFVPYEKAKSEKASV